MLSRAIPSIACVLIRILTHLVKAKEKLPEEVMSEIVLKACKAIV